MAGHQLGRQVQQVDGALVANGDGATGIDHHQALVDVLQRGGERIGLLRLPLLAAPQGGGGGGQVGGLLLQLGPGAFQLLVVLRQGSAGAGERGKPLVCKTAQHRDEEGRGQGAAHDAGGLALPPGQDGVLGHGNLHDQGVALQRLETGDACWATCVSRQAHGAAASRQQALPIFRRIGRHRDGAVLVGMAGEQAALAAQEPDGAAGTGQDSLEELLDVAQGQGADDGAQERALGVLDAVGEVDAPFAGGAALDRAADVGAGAAGELQNLEVVAVGDVQRRGRPDAG